MLFLTYLKKLPILFITLLAFRLLTTGGILCMNCPNCGDYYTENEKICKKCGAPLSNAVYNSVEPSAQKKKRGRVLLIIIILLLVLFIAGGIIGYKYYLSRVEAECVKTTEQIFTYAENMDFSEVPSSKLPEPLKSEPNIKNLIKKQITSYIDESSLSSIIDTDSIDIDTLCDEIIDQASYEIISVSSSYNFCDVDIQVSNVDFVSVLDTVYQKASSEVSDTDSSLWESIRHGISSLLGEESHEEETDISENLLEWYQEAKEEAPEDSYVGRIEFGIENGEWTITSIEEELFYAYYGLSGIQ